MLTPEQIAAQIAEKGAAGDEVLVVMAKGLSDAVGKIGDLAAAVLMLKGKKGGGDDDEPADDKGGDGDGEGGDDAPGYEDMQLADPDGLVERPDGTFVKRDGTEPTVVDVSKYVFQSGAQLRQLAKAHVQLTKDNAELRGMLAKALEGQATLGQMIADATTAQVGAIAPLIKAVGDAREVMLDIPAPGITPHRFPPRSVVAADAALLGGSKRTETQVLAKALRTGLIDPAAKMAFERTRRLSADEATHTAKRKQLDALAVEFNSPITVS